MCRVFVLGAGFSKPAGLPLTTELFGEIVSKAKSIRLYAQLKSDIDGSTQSWLFFISHFIPRTYGFICD